MYKEIYHETLLKIDIMYNNTTKGIRIQRLALVCAAGSGNLFWLLVVGKLT